MKWVWLQAVKFSKGSFQKESGKQYYKGAVQFSVRDMGAIEVVVFSGLKMKSQIKLSNPATKM